jgi:hypothetical protein
MRKIRPSSVYTTSLISYRIKVATAALVGIAREGLVSVTGPAPSGMVGPPILGAVAGQGSAQAQDICLVWIPAPILEAALPAMVRDYNLHRTALVVPAHPSPVRSQRALLIASGYSHFTT